MFTLNQILNFGNYLWHQNICCRLNNINNNPQKCCWLLNLWPDFLVKKSTLIVVGICFSLLFYSTSSQSLWMTDFLGPVTKKFRFLVNWTRVHLAFQGWFFFYFDWWGFLVRTWLRSFIYCEIFKLFCSQGNSENNIWQYNWKT